MAHETLHEIIDAFESQDFPAETAALACLRENAALAANDLARPDLLASAQVFATLAIADRIEKIIELVFDEARGIHFHVAPTARERLQS